MTLLNFLGCEGHNALTTRFVFFTGYGSHYLYCDRMVEAICSMRDQVVRWPDEEESEKSHSVLYLNLTSQTVLGLEIGHYFPWLPSRILTMLLITLAENMGKVSHFFL